MKHNINAFVLHFKNNKTILFFDFFFLKEAFSLRQTVTTQSDEELVQ